MKQIGVKHPEKQILQVSDLTDCLGVSQSDLVRTALSLGMNQIKELAARDKEKAQERVAITAFRVMQ
jgi:hypothetical protein